VHTDQALSIASINRGNTRDFDSWHKPKPNLLGGFLCLLPTSGRIMIGKRNYLHASFGSIFHQFAR
jgi:hypothetical protein